MAEQPLNYVDYDFDTLLTQLRNRLALQGAWKDMYRSATGSMLIELFAAVGTLVLYYVERRAEESYIATAQNKSSLINLARLINYTPRRNASSAGTLRFSLATPATSMVFINSLISDNPVMCVTSGNVNFLASSDGVILPGQSFVDVPGIQGSIVVVTNTSTGSLNQEYNVKDTTVENSHVYVYVNDVLWTNVSSFIDSTNVSENYVIRPELDDTITILFGDNVFGKSPGVGNVITIKYVQSIGLTGNVYALGLINSVTSPVYNALSELQTVSVSNITNFLGGDDAETAEDIRSNAPQVFATGDRLVTKSDFIAVINAFPSVADSNVWGENEESPPNYVMFNQVKIVTILQNWILPDAAFEASLADYLYEKSLMTVRYSFVDPTILYIVPTLYIKITAGSSISYVQSQIEAAISNQFTLGTTTKLGVSKRQSDIIAAIEAIPGVSYNHVILKISQELLSTYASPYNWANTLDAVPLLRWGVEIYIDDVQTGIDDGAGGIISTRSGYVVSGLVDYTTGFIGVNISPAPSLSSTVYARYQQDQNGDIVVTKNQVCKLFMNVYTTISYE